MLHRPHGICLFLPSLPSLTSFLPSPFLPHPYPPRLLRSPYAFYTRQAFSLTSTNTPHHPHLLPSPLYLLLWRHVEKEREEDKNGKGVRNGGEEKRSLMEKESNTKNWIGTVRRGYIRDSWGRGKRELMEEEEGRKKNKEYVGKRWKELEYREEQLEECHTREMKWRKRRKKKGEARLEEDEGSGGMGMMGGGGLSVGVVGWGQHDTGIR